MLRLSVLSRLTWPSVCPLLHLYRMAFSTAFSSRPSFVASATMRLSWCRVALNAEINTVWDRSNSWVRFADILEKLSGSTTGGMNNAGRIRLLRREAKRFRRHFAPESSCINHREKREATKPQESYKIRHVAKSLWDFRYLYADEPHDLLS